MVQGDGDRLLDRYMGRSTRLLWVAGGVVTFLLLLWAILIALWTHRALPSPGETIMFAGASAMTCVTLLTLGCVVLSQGNMATYIHKQL